MGRRVGRRSRPRRWSPLATPLRKALFFTLPKRALAYTGSMVGQRGDGGERRAQIVDVARALFAERGYRSTTTRELARAAGVSDALMYRYFAGKDDVLRAVVDQGIAGFATMGEAAATGRDWPLRERLRWLGSAFAKTVAAQRDLLVLFVSEHQLLADDARLVTFIDRAATGLGAEISRRARAGEFRADLDGYLFARSFMGAIVAFVILQQVLGMDRVHTIDAEAYINELVETHLRGALAAEK